MRRTPVIALIDELKHQQQKTMKAETKLESNWDDYIECALWSSVHYPSENEEPIPFDDVDAEIADSAREELNGELAAFNLEVEALREKWEGSEEFPDSEQIAHDFWLTRNGHGAGFWDRGLGDLGDELTKMAKVWGSVDLYLGDDGLIYSQ